MSETLLARTIRSHGQFCRFLITGAFVVAINLSALFVLTSVLHIYYLLSAVAAFFVAFSFSFAIQKSWTFKDRSRGQLRRQLPLYLGVQLANLACNTMLMFVFVEYIHVWYLLSQAIIAFVLAMAVYVVNKVFIFNTRL